MTPDQKHIELIEKIEEILLDYDPGGFVDNYADKILSIISEAMPEKKTEGILGIAGTTHRDGVVNEGFNDCLDAIQEVLRGTKE